MSSPTPTPTITPTPTSSLLYPILKRVFGYETSSSIANPNEIDELVLESISWIPRTENYSGTVGLLSCEVFVESESTPDPETIQYMFYGSYFTTEYHHQLLMQYECVENGLTKLNTLTAMCFGA